MKRFSIILLIFVLSLTMCFFACKNTEEDKPSDEKESERTVDGGGDTTEINPNANELPLIPIN